jgi:hypothetical protein
LIQAEITTYTIFMPLTCPTDATWKGLELTDNKFAFTDRRYAVLVVPPILAEADRYADEGVVITDCKFDNVSLSNNPAWIELVTQGNEAYTDGLTIDNCEEKTIE